MNGTQKLYQLFVLSSHFIWLFVSGVNHAQAAQSKASSDIQFGYREFLSESGKPTRKENPYGQVQFTTKTKWSQALRSQFRIRLDSQMGMKGEDGFFVDAPEAFLEGKISSVKWTVGNQIYNWAVVDGISGLDVLNPKDISNPLSSSQNDKIGTPSLNFSYTPESWNSLRVDLVYIPYQRSARLPGASSRWLPRDFLKTIATKDVVVRLPQQVEYSLQQRDLGESKHLHNAAMRMSYTSLNWDLRWIQHYGVLPTPSFLVSFDSDLVSSGPPVVLDAANPIRLKPIEEKYWTTGLGGNWSVGNWILRWESSHQKRLSSDSLFLPWSHRHAVAIEKTLALPLGMQWIALLQYSHGVQPVEQGNFATSVADLYQRAFVLGGILQWSLQNSTTLRALYDSRRGSSMIAAEHEWKTSFGSASGYTLSVVGGVAILDGPSQTLLGTYRKNDQASLGLKSSF